MRLPMQIGSIKADLEEGCSVHVLPISAVTATDLEPPRLSRILSIRLPSFNSTTWASVVFGLAAVPIFQVWPWSLLKMMVLCGRLFSSLYCPAKTKVPSLMVIPLPGPLNISFHFGSLIWVVMLMGLVQVMPSSSLFTTINCPVSSGVIPVWELFQSISPGFPCAQSAITQTVL